MHADIIQANNLTHTK